MRGWIRLIPRSVREWIAKRVAPELFYGRAYSGHGHARDIYRFLSEMAAANGVTFVRPRNAYLAERMNVSSRTITSYLQRLEKEGFIRLSYASSNGYGRKIHIVELEETGKLTRFPSAKRSRARAEVSRELAEVAHDRAEVSNIGNTEVKPEIKPMRKRASAKQRKPAQPEPQLFPVVSAAPARRHDLSIDPPQKEKPDDTDQEDVTALLLASLMDLGQSKRLKVERYKECYGAVAVT